MSICRRRGWCADFLGGAFELSGVVRTIFVDVGKRCVNRIDCQTKLRTSTSTYRSMTWVPQSTGPFLPFFPPFLPPFFGMVADDHARPTGAAVGSPGRTAAAVHRG